MVRERPENLTEHANDPKIERCVEKIRRNSIAGNLHGFEISGGKSIRQTEYVVVGDINNP